MSDEQQLTNSQENSTENEAEQKNESETSPGDASVVDDQSVQASLKLLAQTEQLERADDAQSSLSTQANLSPDQVKNIVEAAVLAASKPISLDKLLTLFAEKEELNKDKLRIAIDQLNNDYQSRGVELVEVSSGFRFQVTQQVAPWVSRLWEEKPQKYSRALLETLALVAYRQPITRGEIEEIRGVSVSSQIMRTLVEREWVRVIGHRDVPGKPAMYATTKQFLDYFGLKKLDELPTLSEIRDLDTINAELDFGEPKQDDAESKQISIEMGEDTDADEIDQQAEHELDDSEDISETVRVDINSELDALTETFQKIDAVDIDNEPESLKQASEIKQESEEPERAQADENTESSPESEIGSQTDDKNDSSSSSESN